MFAKILADRVASYLPTGVGVAVDLFDYGTKLGVAIRMADGQRRHAVKVKIERDDLTRAADEGAMALKDWLADA